MKVVGPGDSIQAAIDAAQPGDTIVVKGVHHENVAIAKDGITLRGIGAVLEPAATPLANACTDPTAPDESGPDTPSPDGPPAPADDVALTSADLPKFVHRLVAPMVSPEQGADGIAARPDEANVQAAVQGLRLGGGEVHAPSEGGVQGAGRGLTVPEGAGGRKDESGRAAPLRGASPPSSRA